MIALVVGVAVASSAEPPAGAAPVIYGSLDKELIREVIHKNRLEVRACYEKQLKAFPKLEGKVSVNFRILPSGNVAGTNVVSSTVANVELEGCIVDRVATWGFPKPKGGGVVVVTYPFIFRQDPVPDAGAAL